MAPNVALSPGMHLGFLNNNPMQIIRHSSAPATQASLASPNRTPFQARYFEVGESSRHSSTHDLPLVSRVLLPDTGLWL